MGQAPPWPSLGFVHGPISYAVLLVTDNANVAPFLTLILFFYKSVERKAAKNQLSTYALQAYFPRKLLFKNLPYYIPSCSPVQPNTYGLLIHCQKKKKKGLFYGVFTKLMSQCSSLLFSFWQSLLLHFLLQKLIIFFI